MGPHHLAIVARRENGDPPVKAADSGRAAKIEARDRDPGARGRDPQSRLTWWGRVIDWLSGRLAAETALATADDVLSDSLTELTHAARWVERGPQRRRDDRRGSVERRKADRRRALG